jgi:hypothetical protein
LKEQARLNSTAIFSIIFNQCSVSAAGVKTGGFTMAASNPRPDHVPEENVYNGIHWMVLVTYLAAIGGVAILLVNAG